MSNPRLLYCHCQYAQVVPDEVKRRVLKSLSDSGRPFDAVPDLCELAARRDPGLSSIASAGPLKIAACFPRAVRWLFDSAGAPLALEHTEVVNMRVLTADQAEEALFKPELTPNIPTGKPSGSEAPRPTAN